MNPFKGPSRLGATPVPETPYQRAGQAWDQRIGSARVQAGNWRLIALGLLASNIVQSGGMIWQAARGTVTPWVVEVDRLGQTLAVGPAVRGYRPPDPVIAWTLSRFVENTRALPADPVCLPAPPETYAREIAALPPEQKLVESGDMEVYVALARQASTTRSRKAEAPAASLSVANVRPRASPGLNAPAFCRL